MSYVPQGRDFVRRVILKALADARGPEYAVERWGSGGAAIAKAAIVPLTATDVLAGLDGPATAFLGLVLEQTIIGRLSGLRTVPFGTRLLRITTGSRGYWIGEGKPTPLSKQSLAGSSLEERKAQAIIVVTDESLRAVQAEAVLQADLVRAVAATLDETFLDLTNAGSADRPASVTYNALTISASSDFGADLSALIDGFVAQGGNLATAYFVSSAETATGIATKTDSGGRYLFPDLGPRGGSLLGLPFVTSRHQVLDSNGGVLVIVDPEGITSQVGGIDLDKAAHASLQMSDTPDNPTTAGTVMVSLWQQNLVALRSTVWANWQVDRPAVAVLQGL